MLMRTNSEHTIALDLHLFRGAPAMHDPVAREQKRLSATWLTVMAAGLASAGLGPMLHQLARVGWRGLEGETGIAALICVGVSTCLHILARKLLR